MNEMKNITPYLHGSKIYLSLQLESNYNYCTTTLASQSSCTIVASWGGDTHLCRLQLESNYNYIHYG